jgi:hypothetical protein
MILPILLCTFASAKTLATSASEASSYFSDDSGNYAAVKLTDGKSSEAWVEDEAGAGLGAWVEIQLPAKTALTSIRLWNGNWYSFNEWDYYSRISKLEVQFSDGSKQEFSLKNEKVPELLKLPSVVTTSSVKLIIRGTYPGSAYADRTAISEIQLLNKEPEDFVAAKTITSSSSMPEDNDGSYSPSNVQDMLSDTAWCAGDESGEDQWLELDLGGTKKIKEVTVVNGNAADFKIFMGYGRPKSLVLNFDDGSTRDIAVKPSPKEQTVGFLPGKTGKVRIQVRDVMAGKQYKNACLSEIRFQ